MIFWDVLLMQMTTSDGVQLSYNDKGIGRPIILLTGIGGSREIWAAQRKPLLENGYRVIQLDDRNQGASAHTINGRRIARHAADLAELITQLKLTTCILMGNSMGAATIFSYLSLFGAQNVQAIIDIDQSPKMISDASWPYGFKTLTWENFHEQLSLPLEQSTVQRLPDDTYRAVKMANLAHPYDALMNYPLLLDHAIQDWRDVLLNIKQPCLFVAGEQSPYFNPEFATVSAGLTPFGQSKIIPDCGHIVMAEQPVAFNQVLLSFLRYVDLNFVLSS